MADSNFVVKNTLTVNTVFTANSSSIVGNNFTTNSTGVTSTSFYSGANLVANSINLLWTGNTTTSPTVTLANTGAFSIGNSSTTQTTGSITVANSAGNVQLTAGATSILATGLVNASAFTTTGNANAANFYSGANLVLNNTNLSYTGNTTTSPTVTLANTGAFSIGNSSTTQTTGSITVANSAGNVQLTAGATSILATGSINSASHTTGNTTTGTGGFSANVTAVVVGNNTLYASVNSSSFNLGDTSRTDSPKIYIANSSLNANIVPGTFQIGNSTSYSAISGSRQFFGYYKIASPTFNGYNIDIYNVTDSATNSTQITFNKGRFTNSSVLPAGGNGANTVNGDTLGSLIFKGMDNNFTGQEAASIYTYQDAAYAGESYIAGRIVFNTSNTSSSSNERMRISSNGNIGINNAAPTNTLSVNGTTFLQGNVTFKQGIVDSTGSQGTAGQALTSNGAGNVYWSTIVGTNTAAQYTWSNTQTFQNTITFSTSILANTINATSYTAGDGGAAAGGLTANSTTVYLGNTTANNILSYTSTTVANSVANAIINPRVLSIATSAGVPPVVNLVSTESAVQNRGAINFYNTNTLSTVQYFGGLNWYGSNSTVTNTASITVQGTSLTGDMSIIAAVPGTSYFKINHQGTQGFFTNSTLTSTSGDLMLASNAKSLKFATVNTSTYAYFTQQNDDNFVFYSSNTAYGARAIWSIFANSITSNLNINVRTYFGGGFKIAAGQTILDSLDSQGTVGQVLTSNGAGNVYWSSISGAASVNVQSQYTWTNTQTFSNTITFNSNILVGTSVNAASYTVGTAFTANATMTNTVSLVVSTNTATIGTAAYHVANGNFGISTNAPGYKLHVYGDITAQSAVVSSINVLEDTGAAAARLSSNTTVAMVGSVASKPFVILMGNGETARFDPSGNLGISNTSPAHKLSVNGTAYVGGNVAITGRLDLSGNTIQNYSEYANASVTVSSTANVAIAANSNVVRYLLSSNANLLLPSSQPSVSTAVKNIIVYVKQDATGGRTLAFVNAAGDTIKYNNASTLAQPNSTAAKSTIYSCMKFDSDTNWYISLSYIDA